MSVSCRAFSYFQTCAARGWIDLDVLLEGCRYPREHLEDPSHRVDWDDWAALCDRFVALAGEEAAVRSAEVILEADIGGTLQSLSAMLVSSTALYRMALRYAAPTMYRDLDIELEVLSADRLRVEVRVPPERRGSRGWMLMFRGAMTLLPRILGQSDAVVIEHVLDAHVWRGAITPPPSRTLWRRIRRTFAALFSSGPMLEEFEFQQRQLQATLDDLAAAERSFRETVAAQRQAEAEAEAGRRTLAALSRALPDLVIRLDRSGKPLGLFAGTDHPRAEALLGPLIGKEPAAVVRELAPLAPDGSFEEGLAAVEAAASTGRPVTLDLRLQWRGEGRVFELRVVPAEDDIVLLVRDVTQRRALEQQLAISERMVSLGTLVAGAAHEINNPLTYLTTNLRLALDALEAGEPGDLDAMRTVLAEALDGATRIGGIVDELGRFARPEPIRPSRVDLGAVVRHAIRLAGHELRHRAELVCDIEAVPPVVADENQLVRVVVNLLVNAGQAIDPASEGERRVRVGVRPEGGCVRLIVEDTGRGIPAAIRHRVFDPFFTTKQGTGTGLGLAIVHRIVADSGGTIALGSEEGRGTRFVVDLPAASEAALPSGVGPEVAAVRRAGRARLLIVDDDLLVRRSITRLLREYEVVAVGSAKEAEPLVLADPPDLILCDLMMPGTSGADLHASLEARGVDLRHRILFVSGGAFTPEARAFVERTSCPILQKPFLPRQLQETVQMLLSARATALDGAERP